MPVYEKYTAEYVTRYYKSDKARNRLNYIRYSNLQIYSLRRINDRTN